MNQKIRKFLYFWILIEKFPIKWYEWWILCQSIFSNFELSTNNWNTSDANPETLADVILEIITIRIDQPSIVILLRK